MAIKSLVALGASALCASVMATTSVESSNVVGYLSEATSASSFSQGPMFMIVGNTGDNAGKFQLKDIKAEGMDMTSDFIQFLSSDDASSYMQAVYVGDELPAFKGWWDFNDLGGTSYDEEWFNNGTAFLACLESGNEVTFTYSGEVATGSALVMTIESGVASPFICNPTPCNLTLGDIKAEGMDMTADFFQFLSVDDASSEYQMVYVGDELPAFKGWWDFNDLGGTSYDDLPLPAGGAMLGVLESGNEVVVTFPDPLAPKSAE